MNLTKEIKLQIAKLAIENLKSTSDPGICICLARASYSILGYGYTMNIVDIRKVFNLLQYKPEHSNISDYWWPSTNRQVRFEVMNKIIKEIES